MDANLVHINNFDCRNYNMLRGEDIPMNTKYHDLVESLKVNRDIEGPPKFVAEHVMEECDKRED